MIYKIVSKEESQAGKYIDLDGDGQPEGIIFADLASCKGDNLENNKNVRLPVVEKENLKEYIVQKDYKGVEMLQPILDGEDRFYIMDLKDVSRNVYAWYNEATNMQDYKETTSKEFGSGKQNTKVILQKWLSKEYGKQNTNSMNGYKDMWNDIQQKIAEGWFIPSEREWIAFGYNIHLMGSDYIDEINSYYWSSSQENYRFVFQIRLPITRKDASLGMPVFDTSYVRLARTT